MSDHRNLATRLLSAELGIGGRHGSLLTSRLLQLLRLDNNGNNNKDYSSSVAFVGTVDWPKVIKAIVMKGRQSKLSEMEKDTLALLTLLGIRGLGGDALKDTIVEEWRDGISGRCTNNAMNEMECKGMGYF
jgi:hypothetical protein